MGRGKKNKSHLRVRTLGPPPGTGLPEGWYELPHCSGAIMYIHKESKVIVWSRPYTIKDDKKIKSHDVPSTAIPCLQHKNAMEKQKKESWDRKNIDIKPFTLRLKDFFKPTKSSEPKCDMSLCENTQESAASHNISTSDTALAVPAKESESILEVCNELPLAVSAKESGILEVCNELSFASKESDVPRDDAHSAGEILSTNQTQNCLTDVVNCELAPDDGVNEEQPSIPKCPIGVESIGGEFFAHEKTSKTNSSVDPVLKPYEEKQEYIEEYTNSGALNKYLSRLFEFERVSGVQIDYSLNGTENPPAKPVQVVVVEEVQKENKETTEKKFCVEGKTPFQVLNEYCQKELRVQPTVNKIERPTLSEFGVEIVINGMKFGVAKGDTQKEAKHNAATSTMNIFNPAVLHEEDTRSFMKVFDGMPIEDGAVIPTIKEYRPMGLKYPYLIFLHLLKRNFPDFVDSDIELNVEAVEGGEEDSWKYSLKFKDYQASGECRCKEKRVKQVAAQALIQVLYPQLLTWGSVIRLMEVHVAWQEDCHVEEKSAEVKADKYILYSLRKEMRKLGQELGI